jgi:hypothetical protein
MEGPFVIHPALEPSRPSTALRRAQLVQHARLSVGVSGIAGGIVLLGSNVLFLVLTGAQALPWTPLLANVALIFGGAMFLREYRQRQPTSRRDSTE